MATDDSGSLPSRTLRTGATIPGIGVGTFGSDRYGPEAVASAVATALRLGYRLIDCASVYRNERQVGQVLSQSMDGGIARQNLFIMSKVWNDAHEPERAVASVQKSLTDLRVTYLDAVFVHWPFSNHHLPFASTKDRDPQATPYDHKAFVALWRALESLVDEGLVRHLGTSNVTIPKLELLLRDAVVPPSLNEMELHPTFQQPELYRFCLDHSIQPIGYSPLGSPSRPSRDRSAEDVSDMEDPTIRRIADDRGVHPAVICIKWALARGQIPIPFAVKESQLQANLEAAASEPLAPTEIEALRGVERNARLIKGQVFLWPGADSYLDLWDVDGTIPGWAGYGSSPV